MRRWRKKNFVLPPYGGKKGEYGMKNWKHWAFVAIIAVFGIIVGFIACDNNDNGITPDPTYESVTINLSTIKVDTVKTKIGENIVDNTFYGNGAQFTATVNGSNKPIQTVTWEIIGDIDAGTTISNGILSVAIADHGKTLTIKATSTVDTTKSDAITITAVYCMPSDLYYIWDDGYGTIVEILSDKFIHRDVGNIEIPIIFWETKITLNSEYPTGYYIDCNELVHNGYTWFFCLSVDKQKMVIYSPNTINFNVAPDQSFNKIID